MALLVTYICTVCSGRVFRVNLPGPAPDTCHNRTRKGIALLGRLACMPLNTCPTLQVRLGGAEERFAFQRAVSRLHEMQTAVYLARRAR